MPDILTKVKIHDLFRNLADLEKELAGDPPEEMVALREMLIKTADYPHLLDRIASLEAENGHQASIISGLEAQNLELRDQIRDDRLENDRDQ